MNREERKKETIPSRTNFQLFLLRVESIAFGDFLWSNL